MFHMGTLIILIIITSVPAWGERAIFPASASASRSSGGSRPASISSRRTAGSFFEEPAVASVPRTC